MSHISGAASSGYRVIEVWDSKDHHQAWYDNYVAPNLPPGMAPIPFEYIELLLTVPDTTT